MDLICYLHEGWTPLIRPAPATRPWMDATPEAFAYRCLPLDIANAHGWEVLNPCTFEAEWDGTRGVEAVSIRMLQEADPHQRPVSLFGQGVLTFHIQGLFRTPQGWDLWVGGSPNRAKDAIAPLTGVIETDWSPFTFTMNWRFTRPGHVVRFEAMEPICFLMPVQRGSIEAFEPRFEPLGADPQTQERFQAWSRARDDFHQQMIDAPPSKPSQGWQKHYYRGVDAADRPLTSDHRAKLRPRAFDRGHAPGLAAPPPDDSGLPPEQPAGPDRALAVALARREWLLETLQRQRTLSQLASGIERRPAMGAQAFLDSYYALARPVVLQGAMAGWPALARWTPDHLRERLGALVAGVQAGPSKAQATAALQADLGDFPEYLDGRPGTDLEIAPAGSFTALHHELSNGLIAQILGRQRLKLVAAVDAGRLYNDRGVFSAVADLDDPALDFDRYPRLRGLQVYEVVLEPGEALYLPIGWWRQAIALDFSVTVTSRNFRWPNLGQESFPADPQA